MWNQILQYLYLKPREKSHNINTSLMHGMNRISILVFLIAVIIMIIRALS